MKIIKALAFSILTSSIFLYSNTVALSAANEDIKDGLLSRGVIVRVWSGILHEGENVGHVSLQTSLAAPSDYVSLWPEDGENGEFVPSLAQDLRKENNRNPESTIFLEHPNETALEGLRSDIEFLHWMLDNDHLRWALDGGGQKLKPKDFFTEESYQRSLALPQREHSLYGTTDVWAFNCASVVLNLLKINGYLEQVEQYNSFEGIAFPKNTSVTPDHIAKLCAPQFLHNETGIDDLDTLFSDYKEELQTYNRRMGTETPSFLRSHVSLFGQYWYKSHGERVEHNQNFLGEVDRIIRANRTHKNDDPLSLLRDLDTRGRLGRFVPLVTGQGGKGKNKKY